MIRIAVSFFILAIIAFAFGANGIAGLSMGMGKTLLVLFVIFSLLSFGGAVIVARKNKGLY